MKAAATQGGGGVAALFQDPGRRRGLWKLLGTIGAVDGYMAEAAGRNNAQGLKPALRSVHGAPVSLAHVSPKGDGRASGSVTELSQSRPTPMRFPDEVPCAVVPSCPAARPDRPPRPKLQRDGAPVRRGPRDRDAPRSPVCHYNPRPAVIPLFQPKIVPVRRCLGIWFLNYRGCLSIETDIPVPRHSA